MKKPFWQILQTLSSIDIKFVKKDYFEFEDKNCRNLRNIFTEKIWSVLFKEIKEIFCTWFKMKIKQRIELCFVYKYN